MLFGRRDFVPVVYNVRSLGVRRWTTLVTGLGLALVAWAFTSALMLVSGVTETLKSTGSAGNAKIIRKGSQNEIQSGVLPEHLRLLSSMPEVGAGKDGKPLTSAELLVIIFTKKEGAKSDEEGANLDVRGVGPKALELHPPRSLDGRMFNPGTSEIVIGKGLVGRFEGARLGASMHFARRDWSVVGVMDQGGSAYDSEIWGDVDQFLDAFARRPAFSSVTMKLRDAGAFASLKTRLEGDPNLSTLETQPEIEYWAAQSHGTALFLKLLAMFVIVFFSIAAALGGMITMYMQVDARKRELGTLRALGFRRRAVLVSFVAESVILALGSGVIGIGAASLWQFFSFKTMNFQTFSEMAFRFHLSPSVIGWAFTFSLVLGFAGGLLPAVRAARKPIVESVRG
jgi:ABC-type lipoprotein release transport system permease subunit